MELSQSHLKILTSSGTSLTLLSMISSYLIYFLSFYLFIISFYLIRVGLSYFFVLLLSYVSHIKMLCIKNICNFYRSVSAFSPICNPMNCDWGKKAFNGVENIISTTFHES